MSGNNPQAPEQMVKKALQFDEACVYIGGVSRPTLYKLPIPSYTLGRRRYFLVSELDKFLESQAGG